MAIILLNQKGIYHVIFPFYMIDYQDVLNVCSSYRPFGLCLFLCLHPKNLIKRYLVRNKKFVKFLKKRFIL